MSTAVASPHSTCQRRSSSIGTRIDVSCDDRNSEGELEEGKRKRKPSQVRFLLHRMMGHAYHACDAAAEKNKGERDMEPKEEACEWVKEADHNDRIDGGA